MVEPVNVRFENKPYYLPNKVINNIKNTNSYQLKSEVLKDISTGSDAIIKNNPITKLRIGLDKAASMPIYFAKGLTGNRNSNFYEFLQMGTFPYLTGSLTLILLFNLANSKYATIKDRFYAALNGRRFGAGVVLFGLFKLLGKFLVDFPTKMNTGIDLNLPYRRVIYEFPDYPEDKDLTSTEYHKVFESRDFPRVDLLYKYGDKKGDRFAYHDKIAEKMGAEGELIASDQEVLTKIKEVISKATAAKSISSFLWAAVGVGIASQEPFGYILHEWKDKTWGERIQRYTTEIKNAFTQSSKEFYKGSRKHPYAGKILLFSAVFASLLGNYLISRNFKVSSKIKNPDVINPNKEYEAH